ncbi:MAG: CDP-alcohol phosphatidyltransferase family protein [Steroidobacteraceae bacterium]
MRHIPNLLCVFRIGLIWPLVVAMREMQHELIIVLFLFAAVSDGLDGYLAKRFNWTSDLGKFLDPLADKLLLVTVFIMAAWLGIAPWWLTAAAVARDVMIGLGALMFRICVGPLNGRPTVVSKINTGMQLTYLLAVVLAAATAFPPREVIDALAVVVLITIIVSGTDYVTRFTRRALHAPS